MSRIRMLVLAVAATLGLAAPAAADLEPVKLQILALNDFHGHLESTTPGSIFGVRAGGAEYLATHVRTQRARNPNTLVLSAGDLIGASPLLSALFHDEPTIEAMNRIGLDLNAVGNHEFDEGARELLRMQNGGCHPVDGCLDGDGFEGADFGFLAANVVDRETREPLFPPYAIRKVDGIKVGIIGMTLEGTPEIVTPSGVAGLDFLDEVETADRYAEILRHEHGVRAIVVLLHEGGLQTAGGINDCNGMSGPIIRIAEETTSAVDLFITGHTHQAYNCVIRGRRVTSAASFGRVLTRIDLTLDRRSKDVVAVDAVNEVVTQTVDRATDISDLVSRYSTIAAPLRDRVIGRITADITRNANAAGESPLGNAIADAQLEATRAPDRGGAQIAFMNPGGIRTSLTYAPSGAEAPGEVTYGEAFTVQPFGNSLVTMTLTGAQIETLLEQQWCGQTAPRILQVSAGFSYTWHNTEPVCDRVQDGSLELDGVPVLPDRDYRVTVNSFLADGGDRFAVLREGTARLGGDIDLDAFEAYLHDRSPLDPPALGRIKRIG